jgi:hypothetical protein
VPTMIVLVELNEGVSPEDYERWVRETYAPKILALESVDDWRGYRVGGALGSNSPPPYRYVVSVEINDPEQLERDMGKDEVQRLLEELHGLANLTQLMSERFF